MSVKLSDCGAKINKIPQTERTISRCSVRVRVCRGRAWVGDRAHGIGDVGTDAHDSAAVLTDGFPAD